MSDAYAKVFRDARRNSFNWSAYREAIETHFEGEIHALLGAVGGMTGLLVSFLLTR